MGKDDLIFARFGGREEGKVGLELGEQEREKTDA